MFVSSRLTWVIAQKLFDNESAEFCKPSFLTSFVEFFNQSCLLDIPSGTRSSDPPAPWRAGRGGDGHPGPGVRGAAGRLCCARTGQRAQRTRDQRLG